MLLAVAIVAAVAPGGPATAPGCGVSRPCLGTGGLVKNIDFFARERAPLAQAGLRACRPSLGWESGLQEQAETCVGKSRESGASEGLIDCKAAPRRPARAPARPLCQGSFKAVNAEIRADGGAQRAVEGSLASASDAHAGIRIGLSTPDDTVVCPQNGAQPGGQRWPEDTSLLWLGQGGGHVDSQSVKENSGSSDRVSPVEANWRACASNRGEMPWPRCRLYELSMSGSTAESAKAGGEQPPPSKGRQQGIGIPPIVALWLAERASRETKRRIWKATCRAVPLERQEAGLYALQLCQALKRSPGLALGVLRCVAQSAAIRLGMAAVVVVVVPVLISARVATMIGSAVAGMPVRGPAVMLGQPSVWRAWASFFVLV